MSQSDHSNGIPPRSPNLLHPEHSAVIAIDFQERLTPVIHEIDSVVARSAMLLQGANALEIKVYATEQYPKGLGHTIEPIASQVTTRFEKRMFSIRECHDLIGELESNSIRSVVLVGIETHVCVLQSVLDLLALGFRVHLPVDCCSSRNRLDHSTALRRMENFGAILTTSESQLFEWCETSAHPRFKSISQLVKEKSARSE